MSYIKNCTKCGKRISLREMRHGQWVAFDANSDRLHKHSKIQRRRSVSKKLVNAVNSDTKIATEPALKATDVKLAVRPQKSSKGPKIIAIIFAAIMILYLFN